MVVMEDIRSVAVDNYGCGSHCQLFLAAEDVFHCGLKASAKYVDKLRKMDMVWVDTCNETNIPRLQCIPLMSVDPIASRPMAKEVGIMKWFESLFI